MSRRRPGPRRTGKPARRERASKPPKAEKKRPDLPRWRRIMLLLSLLGFTVFLCPVFGGILNPVNAAAMLGFLALAAVFLFWPGFLRLLKWFWRRPWRRVLLLVSGAGLLALVTVLLALCCRVCFRLRAFPERPCPTLIVLGCQVRGRPPPCCCATASRPPRTIWRPTRRAQPSSPGAAAPGRTSPRQSACTAVSRPWA